MDFGAALRAAHQRCAGYIFFFLCWIAEESESSLLIFQKFESFFFLIFQDFECIAERFSLTFTSRLICYVEFRVTYPSI